METAAAFIDEIKALSKRLEIPEFKDLGIEKDQFDRIAQMSFQNNSTPSNPRKLKVLDYLKILENAYNQ